MPSVLAGIFLGGLFSALLFWLGYLVGRNRRPKLPASSFLVTMPPPVAELMFDGEPWTVETGVTAPMARLGLKVRRRRTVEGPAKDLCLPLCSPVVVGRTSALESPLNGWCVSLDGRKERTPPRYVRIKPEYREGDPEAMSVELLADGHPLKVDGVETRVAGTVLPAKPGSRIELEQDWVFEVFDRRAKVVSKGDGKCR